MRDSLIIDFQDRSLSAVVMLADGSSLPCSQQVHSMESRYLSSEILFDPVAFEKGDLSAGDEAALLADGRGFFSRARRLGLYRPWEHAADSGGLLLRHPFAALSAVEAFMEGGGRRELPGAAAVLLAAYLDPVFAFLAKHRLDPGAMQVVAVIASSTSRRARIVLQKILRARGARHTTLLPREAAAAMALVSSGEDRCVVLDGESEDLRLHSMNLELAEERQRLGNLGSRTLRGLGWSHWVQRIAAALRAQGLLADLAGGKLVALERALIGLAGGPYPTEIPSLPPLRITHRLLDELFQGDWALKAAEELGDRLRPAVHELNTLGCPILALGSLCAIRPLAELFVRTLGGYQPAAVIGTPASERCTRGVTTGLAWLARGEHRRIDVLSAGGLRLNTLRGETVELLASKDLPRGAGERCHLNRTFGLSGPVGDSHALTIQLLWGADPLAEGNAIVCALPLEMESEAVSAALQLGVSLHRGRDGRLHGNVQAALGCRHESRRIEFPDLEATLSSNPDRRDQGAVDS